MSPLTSTQVATYPHALCLALQGLPNAKDHTITWRSWGGVKIPFSQFSPFTSEKSDQGLSGEGTEAMLPRPQRPGFQLVHG
jgi:hypothetical protein